MASQQGGPSALASHDAREASVTADATPDSPYSSDEERNSQDFTCRWRTPEFHDQECYRYFDCPSHLVERRLSIDGTDGPRESAAEATEIRDDHVSPRSSIDEIPESEQEDTAAGQQRGEDNLVADPLASSSEIASGLAAERGGNYTARTSTADPAALPARTSSLPIRTRISSRSIDVRPAGSASSESWGELFEQPSGAMSTSAPAADMSENTSPRMSARDQLSAMYAVDTDRISNENALHHHSLTRSSERERERQSSVVLPRWQPDGEVTYCPICRTQFSIFVRKHHCRKCGRVVCNSCSPHRIIIPHQFIVRAPGSEVPLPPALFFDSSGGGYVDMNGLSGGERVRLCNPCVPDPNTAPPQSPGSPGLSPRTARRRSRNSTGSGYPPSPSVNNRYGGVFAAGQSNDPYQFYTSRTRSITMDPSGQRAGGASSSSSSRRRSSANYEVSSLNRLLAAGPSPFNMQNQHQHHIHRRRLTGEPGSSSRQRALPLPPQIAEEDECPICHLELPSRELPNYEALRESHITTCIQSHSTYGSPRAAPDSATPPPPRRTGMYTYPATEKDCVDDAECTICLEEFTVGIPMARLECLCRFHRSCISAWFVNHPGRCPVHQHDGFGY